MTDQANPKVYELRNPNGKVLYAWVDATGRDYSRHPDADRVFWIDGTATMPPWQVFQQVGDAWELIDERLDSAPECTCALADVTTMGQRARGEVQFVRADPSGCAVHETPEWRERRLKREAAAAEHDQRIADAMRAARLAP